MQVFQKYYTEESFVDVEDEIHLAMEDLKDETKYTIPKDETGFLTGYFKVTVEWSEE